MPASGGLGFAPTVDLGESRNHRGLHPGRNAVYDQPGNHSLDPSGFTTRGGRGRTPNNGGERPFRENCLASRFFVKSGEWHQRPDPYLLPGYSGRVERAGFDDECTGLLRADIFRSP